MFVLLDHCSRLPGRSTTGESMSLNITIKGTFVGSERHQGDFEPDDKPGTNVTYDFTTIAVMRETDVVNLRLPKGVHHTGYTRGEDVEIRATIWGNPRITARQEDLALGVAGAVPDDQSATG